MASSSSYSRSPSTSKRRPFSTLTSPSQSQSPSSSSSSRPPSPPPRIISSPPRSPEPQRRDPNAPPRDPYRDPSSPPPPKQTHYERVAKKRREGEARRNVTFFQCLELQQIATSLLQSNDVAPLRTLIQEFTLLPKRKQHSKKKLFSSLSSYYPNSFSLKLAQLLSTHPPLHIRNEAVLLLLKTLTKPSAVLRISCSMLVELKAPVLEYFKKETEESLLAPLSEAVASLASKIYVFPLGGWAELLEFIVSSVSSNPDDDGSVLKLRKGLMLLAHAPIDTVRDRDFWKVRYGVVYESIAARLVAENRDENLTALAFEALLAMLTMAKPLGELETGGLILSTLLVCADRNANEEIVLTRLNVLGKFVLSDVGEIMKGRENIVFRSMIRIAENKDSSEGLRYTAIQVLKDFGEGNEDIMMQVVTELSFDDAHMALKVSMDMLLCIEDDPLWFEFDKRESLMAGLSESFKLGKVLLFWILFQGVGSIVVPVAIDLVKTTYAASMDWRKQHAGMIFINALANGQKDDVVKCFTEVEKLVINSLNDEHHRVLWAAMNAMRSLCVNNLVRHVQYHMKFFSKLISILKCSISPQIQAEAILAIRALVADSRLDKMASFGDEIVILMLELLKNRKQKIQEEAVETLKLVAVLIPTNFQKYYDTTMESLKAILINCNRRPNKLLLAKSLDCMCSILLKNEFVNFTKEDAAKVMDSFISLEGQLSKRDYLVRNCMLKALDQLLRFPGVDIDRYIIKLMPMLLRSAQLDIDLKTSNMATSDRYLFENERVHALNVLSCGAVLSSEVFSPNIPHVCEIFNACLSCSSSKTQKASVSALPSLLRSVKLGEKDKVIQSTLHNSMVESLVEALHKETHDTMYIRMLNTLPTCIQIAGSVISTELIKEIADEINHILSTWSHKIIESRRAQEAGSPSTSAGPSEYLPDEEIVQSVKLLTKVTAETFKGGLSPYVDGLFSTVAQLWGNDFPDRAKAVAVSIFNVIVPHFPDKLQMYQDMYTYELLKDWDGSLNAQLETARGIGICAKFGGENFKTIVNAAMSRLNSQIVYGPSVDVDIAMISDMAVSALGTICEFHRENIDGPQVIRSWLNFLPLTNDLNEARNVHAQLFKMVKRKDADVLGPNMENLPKIVSILKAILLRSNEELATEETFAEIIEFLDKHDGGLS